MTIGDAISAATESANSPVADVPNAVGCVLTPAKGKARPMGPGYHLRRDVGGGTFQALSARSSKYMTPVNEDAISSRDCVARARANAATIKPVPAPMKIHRMLQKLLPPPRSYAPVPGGSGAPAKPAARGVTPNGALPPLAPGFWPRQFSRRPNARRFSVVTPAIKTAVSVQNSGIVMARLARGVAAPLANLQRAGRNMIFIAPRTSQEGRRVVPWGAIGAAAHSIAAASPAAKSGRFGGQRGAREAGSGGIRAAAPHPPASVVKLARSASAARSFVRKPGVWMLSFAPRAGVTAPISFAKASASAGAPPRSLAQYGRAEAVPALANGIMTALEARRAPRTPAAEAQANAMAEMDAGFAAPLPRTQVAQSMRDYFYRQSRQPPSSMTAFDPLLTPSWGGMQMPG